MSIITDKDLLRIHTDGWCNANVANMTDKQATDERDTAALRAVADAVERAARAAERAEIARKLRDWKADTELFRDDWNRARALALGDAATYVEERAHADSGGER